MEPSNSSPPEDDSGVDIPLNTSREDPSAREVLSPAQGEGPKNPFLPPDAQREDTGQENGQEPRNPFMPPPPDEDEETESEQDTPDEVDPISTLGLPDQGEEPLGEYLLREDVRSEAKSLFEKAGTDPSQFSTEEQRGLQLLDQAYGNLLSRRETSSQEERDLPRAEVTEQGPLEGLKNSFMRGLNNVQGMVTEAPTVAVEGEVEEWLRKEAEEEYEEAAQYPRSEESVEFRKEYHAKKETMSSPEAFFEAAQEDPIGALRFTGDLTAETAPTLIGTVGAGAAGAAATAAGAPAWASAGAMFLAGTALETGAQVKDARFSDEGKSSDLTPTEEALAIASGTGAGAVEAFGGYLFGKGLSRLLQKSSLSAGAREAVESNIGKALKEKASTLIGEGATEVAESVATSRTGMVIGAGFSEGTTETVQGLIADAGAQAGWDPERDIGERWFTEFLAGATLGSGASAVPAVAGGASDAIGSLTAEKKSLAEAAKQADEDELRQMFDEAEDPEAKRVLANELERRQREDVEDDGLTFDFGPEAQATSPQGEGEATPDLQDALAEFTRAREEAQRAEEAEDQAEETGSATEPDEQTSQDETSQEEPVVPDPTGRTAEEEEAALGELLGREVDYNGTTGTLRRTPTGRFEVDPTGDEPPVEVQGSGKDKTRSAQDLGIEPIPQPEVSFDPDAGQVTIDEQETTETLEDISIARDEEGNPVSVTGTRAESGEEITIRRPEVTERVALEQTLAEAGVPPTEGVGAQTQEEAGGTQEEAQEEVQPEEDVAEPEDQQSQGVEGEAAPSAPLIDEEGLREALSSVERESMSRDEQAALQGSLLSNISQVERTLDAAHEGRTVGEEFQGAPITEQDLNEAESWVLETLERVEDFERGDVSQGAQEVAQRVKKVLSGIDRDLTRMRLEAETRPTESQSQDQTTDNVQVPESTEPASPEATATTPDASTERSTEGTGEEFAEATPTVSRGVESGKPGRGATPRGPSRRELGEPIPGIQPRRERAQPAQPRGREPGGIGEEASPQEPSVDPSVVEEARATVEGRGYSPDAVDALESAVANARVEPAQVERVSSIAESIREVEGGPTVRGTEMREAVNVVEEGGLREAAKAAQDPEDTARYNEALQALERAKEPPAQPELAEDIGVRSQKRQEKSIDEKVEEADARVQHLKSRVNQREKEIAKAFTDQVQQGNAFEDQETGRGGQQQSLSEEMSRGEVSTDQVAEAKENDTQLQNLRDQLRAAQNRLEELTKQADRRKSEAREAQSEMSFEEAAEKRVRAERPIPGLAPEGADGEYTVGIATGTISRESGGRTTYSRLEGELVVRNPDGTPVSRQSSYHDRAILAALADPAFRDQVAGPERSVGASVQTEPTSGEVATRSRNPYEIAQAYVNTEVSPSRLEEEMEGRSFTPESVVEIMGMADTNFDRDPNTSFMAWKNSDATRSAINFAESLADEMGVGAELMYQAVADIIAAHPGQNDTIQTRGRRTRQSLNQRFKEVFGFSLGTDNEARLSFAEQVVDARSRAETLRTIREAEEMEGQEAVEEMRGVVESLESSNLTPATFTEGFGLADRMTERQKRALTEAWEQWHHDTSEDIPFRRESGMTDAQIDATMDIVEGVMDVESHSEGLSTPTVVRTPEDLPDGPRKHFEYGMSQVGPGFIQPAFPYKGEIYVVATHVEAAARTTGETIADFSRALLLHEWAHNGMDALWGDNYTEVMSGLADEIGMEELHRVLGENYAPRFEGEVTAQDKALLADEYLAYHAENLASTDPSLFERIVLYLRRAWARITGQEVSEAEMSLMLISAYDAARAEATASQVTGSRFMMIGPDAMTFSEEEAFPNPYDQLLRNEVGDQDAEVVGPLQQFVQAREQANNAQSELLEEQAGDSGARSTIRHEQLQGLSRMEEAEAALRDGVKLSDVLDHPRLYRAYPELRDLSVEYDPELDAAGGLFPSRNTILLGRKAFTESFASQDPSTPGDNVPELVRGILIHEIQHKIQSIEGWQTGSNYEAARDIIRDQAERAGVDPNDDSAVMEWAESEYDTSYQEALYEVYHRVSGEVEAREVGRRRRMNELERTVRPPFTQQDGDLVLPGDEVFTKSFLSSRLPSLKAKRLVTQQEQGEQQAQESPSREQEPPARFSRRSNPNPFHDADESIHEDIESGAISIEEVVPVRTEETPELVAEGRPPVPEAPLPAWAEAEADTREGRRLVSRLESDSDGTSVGKRSIVDMLMQKIFPDFRRFLAFAAQSKGVNFDEAANILYRFLQDEGLADPIEVWDGRAEQVQARARGRTDETLSPKEKMQEWVRLYIQSPGSVQDLQITKDLEEAFDSLNPKYLKALRDASRAYQAHRRRSVKARLRSFNEDKGERVSVLSSEEGEWRDTIDSLIFNAASRGHALDRAYRLIWDSVRSFTDEKTSFTQTLGRVVGAAQEEADQTARRVLSEAEGEGPRPRDWHQATLRTQGEVVLAMEGRNTGKNGLRIYKTDTTLSEEELTRLEEAGFPMDEEVEWTETTNKESATLEGEGNSARSRTGTLREALTKANEGEIIWLTGRSFKEITSQIEDGNWGDFEEYAKRKVDLARASRSARTAISDLGPSERAALTDAIREEMSRQGVTGDRRARIEDVLTAYEKDLRDTLRPLESQFEVLTDPAWLAREAGIETDVMAFPGAEETDVSTLRKQVASYESRHEGWEDVFREMEDFADRALLAAVAGGLKEAEEAVAMKEAYDAYMPLMRDVDNAGVARGAGAWPDSQIQEAKGSTKASKPLIQNFRDRLRQVLDAYYHNASMVSVIRLFERTAQNENAPFGTRELARNIVREVGRIPRAVAVQSPQEIKQIIAENTEGVSPAEVTVENGSRPVIRAQAPEGREFIAPMVNGERVFYEVQDPLLLNYFSLSGSTPDQSVSVFTDILEEMVAPWKRVLTQNFVFAVRNGLGRDPVTATFFGLPPGSDQGDVSNRARQIAPYYYITKGTVERLTGSEIADETALGTLLSDAYEATSSPEHKARTQKAGWESFKSVLQQGVWRDDFASLALYEKLASSFGIAMNVLLKPVELTLWATGQRSFSVAMEENTRIGAFQAAREAGQSPLEAQSAYDTVSGNFGEAPGSGTMHALYRSAGFANPGIQVSYELFRRVFSFDPEVRGRVLATRFGAVAGFTAAAWALNQMVTPDDRQKELDERPDEEKLRYVPLGGTFRVPFDYGPIGAVQSVTYNLLEQQAGRGVEDRSELGKKVLTSLADVPVLKPTGLLNPQLQTLMETEANYNFFFEEEIVPSMLQYQPPPEQAFSDTPGLYKWLGEKTNTSPLKVGHIVRNGLAYPMDEFIQFASAVDRGEADAVDILDPTDPDNPSFRRLWQQDPVGWRSQSVQTLSKRAREFDSAERRYKELRESISDTPSGQVKSVMRRLQDRMRRLRPFKQGMEQVRRYHQLSDRATERDSFEDAKAFERQMTETAREILSRIQQDRK